jgi:DNA (cytosine-5)-methyltransferase 1
VKRPLLLDLFCKTGGAAKGYWLAGFDVIGVDIEPQPRYPYRFVQADALRPPFDLRMFDAIHASPPCQGYSVGAGFGHKRQVPRLIEDVRNLLAASGRPWIIENVMGAKKFLQSPIMLCGAMFGLGVIRHRLFETSFPCQAQEHRCHGKEIDRDLVSVTGHGPPPRWYKRNPGKVFSVQIWKDAMGIDWMTRDELRDAIPSAYTHHLGKQLLRHLKGEP